MRQTLLIALGLLVIGGNSAVGQISHRGGTPSVSVQPADVTVVPEPTNRSHDYIATASKTLTASTGTWSLQMPSAATRKARLKSVVVYSSEPCGVQLFRDGTLATSGTALSIVKVTQVIDGVSVPNAQAVGYLDGNSTGGTQLGPVYRVQQGQTLVIGFDSKWLAPGEVLRVLSSSCTTGMDVSFVHEEMNLP